MPTSFRWLSPSTMLRNHRATKESASDRPFDKLRDQNELRDQKKLKDQNKVRNQNKRRARDDHSVAYQVASLVLQYPDDGLLAKIPLLQAALDEAGSSSSITPLHRVVEHLATTDPDELRRAYVDLFDLSRRHTLYLTYWSDGDTRRRGSALAEIKALYRESDFLCDTRGELTDYLPMVLEFTARVNPQGGRELLIEHRASLELIRIALQEKGSAYADALVAVCATLPGSPPADKASALALRQAPPTERVGLDAGDPRLLPLFTTTEMAMATTPERRGR